MALIAQRRAPETTDGRKAPQAAMHKELDKISFNALEKAGIKITFMYLHTHRKPNPTSI